MWTVQGLEFDLQHDIPRKKNTNYILFCYFINTLSQIYYFLLKNKFLFYVKQILCVSVWDQCIFYPLLLIEEIENKCNFKMCKNYKFPI